MKFPDVPFVVCDTLMPLQFYFSFSVLLVLPLLFVSYCVSHMVDDMVDDFNEDPSQRDISKMDDTHNQPHDNNVDAFRK